MDRWTPTQRPDAPLAGHQKWRELLFVHWFLDPELVRPLVPERLSLDLWEGKAYVGVVPFRMMDIAPGWLPKAFAFNFLETNLRTYVHLDGDHPGVYFFSLEAASWLAVQAARIGWGLPYHHAKMTSKRDGQRFDYETLRNDAKRTQHRVSFEVGEALAPSKEGSLEFFLAERYYLYSEKGGTFYRGQVHHVPYPLHTARILDIEDGLLAAAGLPQPTEPPPLAHYSEGVDVEVFALEKI